MNNIVDINSADFKFAHFTESITKISEDYHETAWYMKLRELDAKIVNENLSDKITFSDDRLVLIAFKVLAETGLFSDRAGKREWFIVKRYLDIYGEESLPRLKELKRLVNMHIGYAYSDVKQSDADKKEFKSVQKILSDTVYEEGYIVLPQFLLDVIEGIEREQAVEEFSGDEKAQWEGLMETAEMMMRDKTLSKKEKSDWGGAYETAKMMLK